MTRLRTSPGPASPKRRGQSRTPGPQSAGPERESESEVFAKGSSHEISDRDSELEAALHLRSHGGVLGPHRVQIPSPIGENRERDLAALARAGFPSESGAFRRRYTRRADSPAARPYESRLTDARLTQAPGTQQRAKARHEAIVAASS